MKPKKQQSADRKQSQSGAVSAPGTPAATTAAADTGTTATVPGSVVATATPTSTPVTATPSTAKKPVKRLQSKAKEASSTEPTAGAAGAGAKLSEKLPTTTQPVAGPVTGGSSTQSNKSKSSGGSMAIVAKTFHPPMGEPAQQPQVSGGPEVVTSSKSAATTATGGGKTAKASKSAKAIDPSVSSPGDPKKKTTPAKTAAGSAKKTATPTDSGKQRRQSAAGQSAAAGPAAKSGGPPDLASPAADRLREKEKKIQKELKNLGVSDKTLHQIDAAYLLADESVNPSISEMVKTKSRTTVAHAKYGTDSHLSPGTMGASGRKPSLTTEDGPTVGTPGDADEKPHKEATSGGKVKKSVTIKLDEDKPPPVKGKAPKGGGRKGEEKTPPGPQPTAEGAGKGKAAATPRSSKSQKKTPETKQQSQQQKKAATSEKGLTEQRKSASGDSGVTKQVSFEAGRGSSVEHEDHEEKNAAVQIQIDSIVKALEREDSDTGGAGGAKKDTGEQADKRNDSTSGVAQGKGAEVKVSTPAGGGTKKPAEPKPARKPALKKDTGSSKGAGEKKKGGGEKKEVTFKEQPPTSPAKRKYVKKPKPAGEKKPPAAKAAKPKPAATGKSKASGGGGKTTAAGKAKTEPKGTAKPSTVAEPTVQNESSPKPADGNDPIPVEEPARSEPSEVAITTPVKISMESQKSQEPPTVPASGGTSLAPTIAQSTHRDRSSTENDDDVPLKQLQAKTQSIGPTKQPETHSATVEPEVVPSKPNGAPVATAAAAAAAGPILAGLLKAGGSGAKAAKRPYVRKNPNPPGKGAKPVPGGCGTQGAKADQRKAPEKKDVYDFDDSESEIEAPVKAGKPSFKRKSSVDLCQSSREDISQPADDPAKPKEPPRGQDAVEAKPQEAEPKKELRSGSSCSPSSGSDAEDGRPLDNLVVPEAKVKKKAPPRRVKHETRESRSSDNEDEEGDPGDDAEDEDGEEQEDEEDDEEDEEDSDGCSSGDTVRTRIAKKRQSAKKRNLKLYGFWSGPKRHRVASLNAIAKVHCLYENERPAFDASLMVRQSSGSRVIRTITKDGERIKKERICDDESAEGGDGDGGRLSGGDGASEDQDVGKGGTAPSDRKGAGVKQERKSEPPAASERAAEPKGTKVSVKVEPAKKEPASDPESDSSEEEPVVTRTLRCVPGLRGAGKHWDPDASSMESDIEQLPDSDETYAQGKDTDPTRKRKLRKKAAARKSKAKQAALAKQEKDKDKAAGNEKPEKAPPKPPVKKIKKELKALLTDTERQDDGAASSESSTGSEKAATTAAAKSKDDGAKKRKREPKVERAANEGVTDYTEYIGKKRMASLNATAMLAATYEVQRTLYRNTDSSDSECSAAEKAPKSKKAKEQKDQKDAAKAAALATAAAAAAAAAADAREKKEAAAKEPPPANVEEPSTSSSSAAAHHHQQQQQQQQEVLAKKKKVVIKTEPMRDRKDDPMEVKREIEEPRPVSSNLVIAQDTEVTITGVYVNSTLGTNQEAYCKMQYRVQQSVTEERLVRPGDGAPPKSYTPLSALSSMRPPNDQSLSTPPLFVPPAQCDSPLLGPPRPSFYPPPTSSSGSSSAFCAPLPHDSPGTYRTTR
ncbi:mucin-19-like [Anopheles bellator]|uniref:mucin-19-like n=1 Tax=Anopheles bellator TaxID=139047 RepID=UPI002648B8E7|nr:mucin-19-like [Anopheles bellator]